MIGIVLACAADLWEDGCGESLDEGETLENLISIAIGLGLAAACGFRVFVPLLVMSAAAYSGHLDLAKGFEWLGTLPALVAFATATAVEIIAYYVPWVDNLLDSISGPAAIVAGAMVMASALTNVDPFLKWSLAIIGGGGVAGIVSGSTAVVRGFSSVTTAGFGNFIVSTVEAAASLVLSVLALVLPLIALAAVFVLVLLLVKKLLGGATRRQAA